MNGDRVAVILDISEKNSNEEEEKLKEEPSKPSIYWIDGTFPDYLQRIFFFFSGWSFSQFNVDGVYPFGTNS